MHEGRVDTFEAQFRVLDEETGMCSVCAYWNYRRPISQIEGAAKVITDSGAFNLCPEGY